MIFRKESTHSNNCFIIDWVSWTTSSLLVMRVALLIVKTLDPLVNVTKRHLLHPTSLKTGTNITTNDWQEQARRTLNEMRHLYNGRTTETITNNDDYRQNNRRLRRYCAGIGMVTVLEDGTEWLQMLWAKWRVDKSRRGQLWWRMWPHTKQRQRNGDTDMRPGPEHADWKRTGWTEMGLDASSERYNWVFTEWGCGTRFLQDCSVLLDSDGWTSLTKTRCL